VISKLAYLALCRSIHLLVLLARGDAAKDLEILVLRHQLTVLAAKSHVPGSSPPTAPCSPRSAAPAGLASCQARDAALAPPPRRGRLDLSTPRSRATAARPGAAAADRSVGQREPALGLLAHPGGAAPLGMRVSATAIRTTLRRRGMDLAPRPSATTWRRSYASGPPGSLPATSSRRYHLYLPVRHPSRRRSMADGLCD
jgi:putative transposase